MKIIVCIKQVPNTTEIKIDPVTNTLKRDGVPSIINPDDKTAIEVALSLKEKTGATVTVITMGPAQAEKALREALAMGVTLEIEKQIPALERAEIARASIDNNGKIIVVPDFQKGIEITNELAPEHLELCVDNPFDYLDQIRHAGSIFMGRDCPEALGDYMAGPNHTLPTGGTAKFSSPLSVDDFVKKTQYTYFTRDALAKVGRKVAYFAEKEGLTAHAKSAVVRLED